MKRFFPVLAAGLSAAAFLAFALPALPSGPVLGPGQDEWHNMLRGLRALTEGLSPGYFIHPALYYEALAGVYCAHRFALSIAGALAGGGYLDYFLAHEAEFLGLARGLSAAFGALAAAAGAWLGFELGGAAAACACGLLLAALPLHVSYATFIRVDSAALACFLAAAALLVRWARTGGRPDGLAAAAGIGLAAAANYPGALLLGLLAALDKGGWKERLRTLLLAAGVSFAVFMLLNPYVLIDLPRFLSDFRFQAGTAFSTHPHAGAPSVLRYLQVVLDQGPLCAVACAAGLAAAALGGRPARPVAAFGVLYLLLFSLLRSQYDRFALPGIALLSVAGACQGLAWLEASQRRWRPPAGPAVLLSAAVLLWGAMHFRTHRPRIREGESDYRTEMLSWVLGNVPRKATLVFESDTLPLLQAVLEPGPLGEGLNAAFRKRHPAASERLVKAQYIGGVVNYEPSFLERSEVYFLGSSLNRAYLASRGEEYPGPAAFYGALDSRAEAVFTSRGADEELVLYRVKNGNGLGNGGKGRAR